MAPDLKILHKAHKKNQRYQWVASIVMMCVGAALIIFPPQHGTAGQNMLVIVLGILIGGMGIALAVYTSGLATPKKYNLHWVLKNRSKRIVWVYHHIVQTMPYGVAVNNMTTVYFYQEDKEHLSLKVPLEDIEILFKYLRERLPHATFGHSEEKSFLFHTDPRLLRK